MALGASQRATTPTGPRQIRKRRFDVLLRMEIRNVAEDEHGCVVRLELRGVVNPIHRVNGVRAGHAAFPFYTPIEIDGMNGGMRPLLSRRHDERAGPSRRLHDERRLWNQRREPRCDGVRQAQRSLIGVVLQALALHDRTPANTACTLPRQSKAMVAVPSQKIETFSAG